MEATTHTTFKALTFLVLAACISAAAMVGCSTNPPVPAKLIDGVWTTPSPVIFYNEIDSCGTYQAYSRLPVQLSLTIIFAGENLVDAEVSAVQGAVTRLDTTCTVADTITFPTLFQGIVNQTQMILEEPRQQYDSAGAPAGILFVEVATFTLTDPNTLTGTFVYKNCSTYCTGFETDTDLCILTRKN
jgi:hypothetical protein